MSLIEYTHGNENEFVVKKIDTGNQLAEVYGHLPYRVLRLSLADGQAANDGTDTETVTIKVVSGLDVARGESPTVLDCNGDVTITVDGKQTTKTLANGSVSFNLATDKPAGSEIEVVAESLENHPAKSDSTTIEVVSQ